ncbi:MAG TPA: SLBB domain-containing protein [Planctomycetota bacterium]
MRTVIVFFVSMLSVIVAHGAEVRTGGATFVFEGGERVRIDLEGQSLPLEQIVTCDGYVSVPMGGAVNVAGKNLQQATEALVTHIETSVGIKKPKVSIAVLQPRVRKAYIEGEVTHPQSIELLPEHPMSLAAALAMAEGPTPDADITHIKVVHHGAQSSKVEIVDASAFELIAQESLGPVLQSGDVVIVPRAGTITVVGEINQPGVFSRKHLRSAPDQPMRLSQAIAAAGGAKPDADLRAVILVRTQNKERRSTAYDVDAALEQHDINQDPALADGDQIVVPASAGFTVLGKVHTPGSYFGKPMTLSRLIALAGGLEQFAKKSGIVIARKNDPGRPIHADLSEITKDGRMEKDIPLNPGDIVYVGENMM